MADGEISGVGLLGVSQRGTRRSPHTSPCTRSGSILTFVVAKPFEESPTEGAQLDDLSQVHLAVIPELAYVPAFSLLDQPQITKLTQLGGRGPHPTYNRVSPR